MVRLLTGEIYIQLQKVLFCSNVDVMAFNKAAINLLKFIKIAFRINLNRCVDHQIMMFFFQIFSKGDVTTITMAVIDYQLLPKRSWH